MAVWLEAGGGKAPSSVVLLGVWLALLLVTFYCICASLRVWHRPCSISRWTLKHKHTNAVIHRIIYPSVPSQWHPSVLSPVRKDAWLHLVSFFRSKILLKWGSEAKHSKNILLSAVMWWFEFMLNSMDCLRFLLRSEERCSGNNNSPSWRLNNPTSCFFIAWPSSSFPSALLICFFFGCHYHCIKGCRITYRPYWYLQIHFYCYRIGR